MKTENKLVLLGTRSVLLALKHVDYIQYGKQNKILDKLPFRVLKLNLTGNGPKLNRGGDKA